ncbi:hypothetical protein GJAV_G00000980 [Gymnothorax javanicus]|nr:hypothetical protein GJAV_G00000980 [Gymnothorax javanicus]
MAIVFTALRVLLGVLFAVAGAVKLTDQLSEDIHSQMQSHFVEFSSVFPLRIVGVELEPELYMLITGWVELVGGVLLAFGPRLLQEISNLVLSVLMMVVIFTLLKLQQPLPACCVPAVFLLVLLLLAIRGRGGAGAKHKSQ